VASVQLLNVTQLRGGFFATLPTAKLTTGISASRKRPESAHGYGGAWRPQPARGLPFER